MGLTVRSVIQLDNGIELTDAYWSFGKSAISVRKIASEEGEAPEYEVRSIARLYISIDAREDGRDHIFSKSVSIRVDSTDINENAYGILYDKVLKVEYPDSFSD